MLNGLKKSVGDLDMPPSLVDGGHRDFETIAAELIVVEGWPREEGRAWNFMLTLGLVLK